MRKEKETWHYECQNGHKWTDKHSPKGTYLYGESGQTRCPKCGTPICRSNRYVNGRKTGEGAIHVSFKIRRKYERRTRKKN